VETTGLQDFSKYFFPLPQKQNMRRDEHRCKQICKVFSQDPSRETWREEKIETDLFR
jgi:hypothetical protein